MSTPISDEPSDPRNEIDPLILQAMAGLPDDFEDFPRLFQEELQPALRAQENERQNAVREARRWSWIGGLIAVVGAFLGFTVFRVPQLAIVAAVIGFAVHGAGRTPLKRITRRAKDMIVEPVANVFGLSYEAQPEKETWLQDVYEAGLLPRWDRAAFEDQLSGERNGVGFEFFEAHLEQRHSRGGASGRTGRAWVSVFRGQCLRFRFHKRFSGHTLVLRDTGFLNRFGGSATFQPVQLESRRFEEAFEVYSTDQVEARYILTPDLMQRLIELEKVFRSGALRCAFVGGELFVTLEGGNMFEPGGLFTPLDEPERLRELLDDFAAVFNLIDRLAAPSQLKS